MSPSNLLTSCWGPVGWAFLHSVTFGYPEVPTKEDADAYRRYFYALESVLPCDSCRKNYRKNLGELPIDRYLGSRKELAYWGYLLHEMVNDELGVKERLLFEDVWKHYESMRSEGCSKSNTCFDPTTKKRCKVHYITDKEEFTNSGGCTWPYMVTIGILVIIVILLVMSKIKIRK